MDGCVYVCVTSLAVQPPPEVDQTESFSSHPAARTTSNVLDNHPCAYLLPPPHTYPVERGGWHEHRRHLQGRLLLRQPPVRVTQVGQVARRRLALGDLSVPLYTTLTAAPPAGT
eukprot:365743-Chlamydomonas_euryale.AAC.1